MKVALDFDGVLAYPYAEMERRSSLSDGIFDTWHNEGEHDEYIDLMQSVWDGIGSDVPAVEKNVDLLVGQLHIDHDVDIVTNTLADTETVKRWLDEKNVPYRDIVHNPSGFDKSDLDYDVFIEDNPTMVGDVDRLYLFDRRWNRDVDVSNDPSTTRVYSLLEVIDDLPKRQVTV